MAKQPPLDNAGTPAERVVDDATRSAARTADAAARAGLRTISDAASRSASQAREGMEQLSAQGDAAFRQSQESMGAVAEAGGVLMQGAQEISQAWMNLAQDRMRRMAEGMQALAACRTPADLIKAQNELVQGAMEQMIDTNRRVADVSMRVMQEVTGKVTTPAKRGPG